MSEPLTARLGSRLLELVLIFQKRFRIKIIDNNFGTKFSFFLLYFLHSNHERRINYFAKNRESIPKKNTHAGNVCLEIEDPDRCFQCFNKSLSSKKNVLVVYIGDSLIEYLSRIRLNSNTFSSCLAIWLGPKTRLGLNLDSDLNFFLENTSRLISNYSIKHSFDDIILVLSIGTIDIRCSIYELELRKLFNKPEELQKLYQETSSNLVQKLIEPLRIKLQTKHVVILSELDSTLVGEKPENIQQLKVLRETNIYPTLGDMEYRKSWRYRFNKISRTVAKENGYKYLDINTYISDSTDPARIQFDGVHISDPSTVFKINNRILNLFNF